jgi:hypothetical protein
MGGEEMDLTIVIGQRQKDGKGAMRNKDDKSYWLQVDQDFIIFLNVNADC